ncbi:histidine phosphatase family protein [Candidatus Berkelbacteria bacterium]|nr:histidine phosphatase family protein [Candidatus Berkelbacteria bacterium]
MAVQITYFVHGTTTDNEQHRTTGWNPGELSELGIKQAKELPRQIGDVTFDAIISSDLKRAVDSAELGFGDQYTIVQDERLRECNYGDLNGAPDSARESIEHYIDIPYPSGESYKHVEQRIRSLLTDIARDYPGKHVAFMAHHAPQLALEVLLSGKSWHEAIASDWRNDKRWQAGWHYVIPDGWPT